MPSVDLTVWAKRIQAARRRRDKKLDTWAANARLHTNLYQVRPAENDDRMVEFPNGDQVKLGLIFKNLEQTRAELDIPEIAVRARLMDFTQSLGREETHREMVVESALGDSLALSGLLTRGEAADMVKLHGMLCGHGVLYTWWREETEAREIEVPVLTVGGAGRLVPVVDKAGAPLTETETTQETTYAAVEDEAVSPIEFLFSADAPQIAASDWYGREYVMDIDAVRADARFDVPDDMSGMAFQRRNIYGEDTDPEFAEREVVRVIEVWDKPHRELIRVIEMSPGGLLRGKQGTPDLHLAGESSWPAAPMHPDDSPFSFYIPIPAVDEPFGIDQIEHVRLVAMEGDKVRTRAANMTRHVKRIPFFDTNKVDAEQMRKAYNGPDVEPVGVTMTQTDTGKPGDYLGELTTPTVHRDLYQAEELARRDVDEITGSSATPSGGAETATEAERVFAVGHARSRRKRDRYLAFLGHVAQIHTLLLGRFAPNGQRRLVYGADGTPLLFEYGRAAFRGRWRLTALPSGESGTASPVEQKAMIEVANLFVGRFGPVFDKVFARQLLTRFNFRDIDAMLQAMQMAPQGLPGLPGLPAPGQPDGRGRADAFNPNNETTGQVMRAAANTLFEGVRR